MVKSMNRRWLSVWVILSVWLFAGLLGYGVAVSSLPVNAQAIPTPVNKPKVTVLANTPYTLMLMKDNFTVFYWVDGKEHPAEYKQETLPGGAHYQFGLAMPAWVAVIGRYPDGRWKLSVEPNTGNGQAPGSQFAPVTGITLVEPVEGAATPTSTGTPTIRPSPTGNPGPSVTLSVTPVGPTPTRTATPTPAPVGTPIIIPFTPPPYKGSLTIYGNCDGIMPWSYLYNKVYDGNGNIIAADKVDCVTYAQLRAAQNLEAVATIDAGVPVITGTLRMVFPTQTPTATLSQP